MKNSPRRKRTFLVLLVACFATALFSLVYPMYVIRPFRAQGVQELAAALVVLRFRTAGMLVCAAGALIGATGYWRLTPGRWRRAAAAGSAAGVCIFAGLSQVNVYEMMFHPMGAPTIESAADTKLDQDEKVLAILVKGSARAYPVRSIAYHHIVNDMVGGVPIVATY